MLVFPDFLHPQVPICRALSLPTKFQLRRYAGSVCPSAHRTHLSNRPDVLGGDNTLGQFGARAQRAAAPPGARCLFSA